MSDEMKAVITRLETILAAVGFGRRGITWNRHSGDFVDVFDLQKSKSRRAYGVNIGVLVVPISTIYEGSEIRGLVRDEQCTVRSRLGVLAGLGDRWWDLSDESAVDDVARLVTEFALPFLDEMHSIEAARQSLAGSTLVKGGYPPGLLNLAIANALLGDREEAFRVIELAKSRAPTAWSPRIEEVSKRLNAQLNREK